MGLPGLNYVVLDANQLRKDGVVSRLIAEYRATGQRIVLPWVHLYEQSKASTAESFDLAHAAMRAEPAAFTVAKASMRIIHAEQQSGPQLAFEAVEDAREGDALRTFLADPRPTADLSPMATRVEEVFHRIHKPGWGDLLKGGVTVDDDAQAKRIHKGLHTGDRGPLREAMVSYVREGSLERNLRGLLADNEPPADDPAPFLTYPSISALTLWTYMCLGLRWKYKTPKKQHEDNPAADTEAVLIALYGRGFLTDDGDARDLHDDMRCVAGEIWP